MYINLITLVTHFNFLSPHDRLKLRAQFGKFNASYMEEHSSEISIEHWVLPYVIHHNKEWEVIVSNWSKLCLTLLPSRSNERKDLLILGRVWMHILMEVSHSVGSKDIWGTRCSSFWYLPGICYWVTWIQKTWWMLDVVRVHEEVLHSGFCSTSFIQAHNGVLVCTTH